MKHLDFLARHPVFTGQEFGAALAQQELGSARASESLLAYYLRTGRILRVRRGLYAVVPAGVSATDSPVDPYLIAAKMTDDAVIGYHTALEFYGKTYSLGERFLYLTEHTSRPTAFRSYQFRGVPFPKELRGKGKVGFGVVEAERGGLNLRVTSYERTLVDMLDRPDLGGGWEEVWRSLEAVEFFDLDKVVEYALLLGNSTTTAKVGFFLEQHRDALMVDESHLRELRPHVPRQPHYMDRGDRQPGRLLKEWNLIVPVSIIERSWQEVA